MLKIVIRKYLAEHHDSYWSDIVPYALMAMRMTIHLAHNLPPFTIVTGRYPALPSHIPETRANPLVEPNYEDLEEYAGRVLSKAHELCNIAMNRLLKNDQAVRRRLLAREKKYAYPTTLFFFEVGQLVLRRRKRVGKLATHSDGPYRVMKVVGKFNQRVTIVRTDDESGSRSHLEVHAS